MIEPMLWEKFEWRTGADRYRFEIERGGLFATLEAPGQEGPRRLTMPLVAWEGLLEAVRTNRKTKSRVDQPQPLRYGANWCTAETQELRQGYSTGRTIADLADAHGRTAAAIEAQLTKIGMLHRPDQRGDPGPLG